MTKFDVEQAAKAYGAWDKALVAGDSKGQARAEFFLNKLAARERITRAQLLAIVQEESGVEVR
jgi:hypothetical protein